MPTVRLATFNVMHGRSLGDGRVEPARLRSAVAALDADVLGLQEVDRAQPRSGHLDLTAEAAAALGPGAVARFAPALVGTPGAGWRPARDDDPQDGQPAYGVSLVSRLPVRSWQVFRLPRTWLRSPVLVPGPQARLVLLRDEPRVVLAAVVELPGGPATVATTHLSFVPGWNVVQLRRTCAALRRLPAPRFLVGDLNLPGPLAGPASGWQVLARVPTYPATAPRVQFDHVLADGADLPAVTGVQASAMELSDHCALTVDLSFNPDVDRESGQDGPPAPDGHPGG